MIIRKLICPDSRFGCMEGSGAGSGGGGDKRSKGTTFGVDGVSKTGSTAKDAAIGFTAGEGTGKAGSNFAALSGATTEQTGKAVAAAQAAQKAGTSPQRAAAAAIGAPTPVDPLSKALGLDSPYARPTTAADEAAFDAFLADEARETFRAGEVAGIGRQPLRQISPSTPGMTGPGSFMSGAKEISGVRPEAFSSSPLASLLTQMQQTPAVDLSGVSNTDLFKALQGNPTYKNELQQRALSGSNPEARSLYGSALMKGLISPATDNLGYYDTITELGGTVPEDVAGTYAMDDLAGDLALNPDLFAGAPVTMEDAQAAISADRVLAPAQVGPPAAQMQSIGPAAQLPQGEYYGEDLQQPDIFGTPGGEFTELYGFPDATALGEFQAQAMRGPKALSQVMDFSLLNRGIQALTGKSPSEATLEGGRQSMRDILAAGGKFNPDTGRIEAELPSGRLQMNNLGLVTYSGMPDPSYSGPFANLVNPPEQERGGGMQPVMEQEVVNPCPEGYSLVNGVCQPLAEQAVTAAATPTAVTPAPMSFQPMYQPFQPQPINPFVLSPTGAALGRSV